MHTGRSSRPSSWQRATGSFPSQRERRNAGLGRFPRTVFLPCRHSDDAPTPACAPLIISSPPGAGHCSLEDWIDLLSKCLKDVSMLLSCPRLPASRVTALETIVAGRAQSCLIHVHSHSAASRSTQCGCRLCFFLQQLVATNEDLQTDNQVMRSDLKRIRNNTESSALALRREAGTASTSSGSSFVVVAGKNPHASRQSHQI